eukprot:Awhi_evm1s10489
MLSTEQLIYYQPTDLYPYKQQSKPSHYFTNQQHYSPELNIEENCCNYDGLKTVNEVYRPQQQQNNHLQIQLQAQ